MSHRIHQNNITIVGIGILKNQGVKQSWLDEKKDGILNAEKVNWKERIEI